MSSGLKLQMNKVPQNSSYLQYLSNVLSFFSYAVYQQANILTMKN